MTKKMACKNTKCEWIGSEDQIDWKFPGDYTQDDVACCPVCGEGVRYAKFWLLLRLDEGRYMGTSTCEAETIEEASTHAVRVYAGQDKLGIVCDIFGPFDELPESAL